MRRKLKKKVVVIFLLIIILIGGFIYYKKTNNTHKDNAVIAKLGNLSANFLNGNVIDTNSKEKKMSFSVTNDSEEDVYYSIKVENIKKLGKDVSLVLNNKTKIKLKNKNDVNILSGIKIAKEETQHYEIMVSNPKMANLKFEIVIAEEKEVEDTITRTIINNNTIKSSSLTKPGEELGVNDEGLISDLDDSGITYYFRGNVTNNYFRFADKNWRIVRINGDNSIRLILDENVSVLATFSDEKTEYSKTHINDVLNEWFEANLFEYQDYIYKDKYCYDYNLTSDNKTFSSYNRLTIAKSTSFNCESDPLNLSIGLLSVDEAIYAGLLIKKDNTSNYLYNEKIEDWWLMSPALYENEAFNIFTVTNKGSIDYHTNSAASKTLRPVINLSPNYKVEGTGTKDDPYIFQK